MSTVIDLTEDESLKPISKKTGINFIYKDRNETHFYALWLYKKKGLKCGVCSQLVYGNTGQCDVMFCNRITCSDCIGHTKNTKDQKKLIIYCQPCVMMSINHKNSNICCGDDDISCTDSDSDWKIYTGYICNDLKKYMSYNNNLL